MKILIISFYYEPDLCPGSFRTTSFVKALNSFLKDEDVIEVVTTLPNRYSSFAIAANEFEVQGKIRIRRIKIPLHKSGFYDQAKSFFVYFIKTLTYVRREKYDVIFATSSRLFSAFLGAIIARYKKAPLYLDIRDIFTDTMRYVLRKSKKKHVISLLVFIEKFTIRSANNVNLVSPGFVSYFRERYGQNLKCSIYSNGIDEEFLHFKSSNILLNKEKRIRMTYTGNIGEGQGLEKIVPQIAQRYPNIDFYIIGDGGQKKVLLTSTAKCHNVRLLNPVNRRELIDHYEKSDILFFQLNDYDAFKRVLPSKIFEYAATLKPIIAGVDGFARRFLEEHLPDAMIYKPCDIDGFCHEFDQFNGRVDIEKRRVFINKYSRKNIMKAMTLDLLSLLES